MYNHGFDITEANVVCRQLGYSGALSVYTGTRLGQGTGQIWIDNVRFSGTESSLGDCLFDGWGVTDCLHSEDVGVMCCKSSKKCVVAIELLHSHVDGQT